MKAVKDLGLHVLLFVVVLFPKQFTVRGSQTFLQMCPPFVSLLAFSAGHVAFLLHNDQQEGRQEGKQKGDKADTVTNKKGEKGRQAGRKADTLSRSKADTLRKP